MSNLFDEDPALRFDLSMGQITLNDALIEEERSYEEIFHAHRAVDAIEDTVGPNLKDISGEAFAKLTPQDFSAMMNEAFQLNGIQFRDNGKPYGSEVISPSGGISGRGGTELV